MIAYEKIKDRLVVIARNMKQVNNMMSYAPHDVNTDLVLLYRVRHQFPDGEIGNILITHAMLGLWGIEEAQLKRDA